MRFAAAVIAVAFIGCAAQQKPPPPSPPPSANEKVALAVQERVEAVFALRERAQKLKRDSGEVAELSHQLQGKRLEVSEKFNERCEPKPVTADDDCAAMSQAWVDADVSLLRACEAERVNWKQWLALNDETMRLNQALADLEPECPKLTDEQARKACDDMAWEGKGRLQFKGDGAAVAHANSNQLDQLCEMVKREAELVRARALKRGY
jgi:hypothetical protein